MNDLAELKRQIAEPLNPELVPYVYESDKMGMCLKHPLVFQIPLTTPGIANDQFKRKQELLDEMIADGQWFTVIFLHERPYRTEALIDFVIGTGEDGLPIPLVDCDQESRDLAASVWIDSENLDQHEEEWEAMFRGAEGKLILAHENDIEAFESLNDTLTVYRGMIDDGGWSWSLDRKVAEFFAHRFGATSKVVRGTVAKADVFGYLTNRAESEVLIPEGKVQNVEVV